MTTVRLALFRLILCLAVICVLAGCSNYTGIPLNDEDNPDFLAGKRRKSSMDFSGAIEAFERALQANPSSADAHFEVGLLFEQHSHDYASAIHHYQKHLKHRPESNLSDMVLERINSCKVELAKTVSFSLVSKKVYAELTRLATENAQLRERILQLDMQLAGVAQVPAPGAGGEPEQASAMRGSPDLASGSSTGGPPRSGQSTARRAHVIQRADTFYSLAKKFGVSLQAMKTANPTVIPERLKVGSTINIPPAGN